MKEFDDHAFEQQLNRLVPRGAPGELRERILVGICDSARPAEHRLRRFLLDQMGSLTTAAMLLLAAIAWLVNLHLQERRLAALLGPTPAERRVERLVESVERTTDPEHMTSIRDALLAALKRSDHDHGNVAAVDSVTANRTFLWELWKDEVEEDRANPSEHRGDTTDHRRVDQLEVARTA
jgi:hypothetical protein